MVTVVQNYTISVRYHSSKELVIANTLSWAFITDEINDPILEELKNVLQITAGGYAGQYCYNINQKQSEFF